MNIKKIVSSLSKKPSVNCCFSVFLWPAVTKNCSYSIKKAYLIFGLFLREQLDYLNTKWFECLTVNAIEKSQLSTHKTISSHKLHVSCEKAYRMNSLPSLSNFNMLCYVSFKRTKEIGEQRTKSC